MFIHDAILGSVTCGDTQIAATNLRTVIAKLKKKDLQTQTDGFQSQFKVRVHNTLLSDDLVPISLRLQILEQVSPNLDELQCKSALSNPDRNRGLNFFLVSLFATPNYLYRN